MKKSRRQPAREITGKRFGRWVVVSFAFNNPDRSKVYNCVCDCGTERVVKGSSLRGGTSKSCGCLKSEILSTMTGDKNPHWKGGAYVNDIGYAMVYSPNHHRASANGYVREHIILAERALGRPLPPGAQVHHYGDRADNSKLVICENQEYHHLLHVREKAMRGCGDPSKLKCKFCQEYDDQKNMYVGRNSKHGRNVYHRSCAREYDRKRRRAL